VGYYQRANASEDSFVYVSRPLAPTPFLAIDGCLTLTLYWKCCYPIRELLLGRMCVFL